MFIRKFNIEKNISKDDLLYKFVIIIIIIIDSCLLIYALIFIYYLDMNVMDS